MYLSPQQAQKRFGYHPKTLAEWADEGKIEFIRSPGGHRRYLLTALEGKANSFSSRRVVIYARVSTHSQKEDLASQAKFLQEARSSDELIKEIGSGMNLKRRKFLKLMQRVADGEIGEIIVGHKDRLCRFGFDFVEWFCQLHHCQITVLGKTDLSPYKEVMQDFMSIMHCFSSRLYFLRRYKDEMAKDPEANFLSPFDKTESNVV
jgi:Predicted site-specific integrase-resolvase